MPPVTRLKTYYIVSVPAENRDAVMDRLRLAGFEHDRLYSPWHCQPSGDRPESWIYGGRVADEDIGRVRAVEGVSVSFETSVDPFLRRDQGGFTY